MEQKDRRDHRSKLKGGREREREGEGGREKERSSHESQPARQRGPERK